MNDDIDPDTGLVYTLTKQDYVEAAQRCLAIEKEMYVFYFFEIASCKIKLVLKFRCCLPFIHYMLMQHATDLFILYFISFHYVIHSHLVLVQFDSICFVLVYIFQE